MTCADFRIIGSAIIDGEATDNEIKEFNEHILTCGECAAWFDAIKILKDGCGDLVEAPPPELKERVMFGIKNANKKPSFFSRFRFTAVAAAVVLIVFAANSFSGAPTTESAPMVINDGVAVSSRMAPQPDSILPGESTATPEVPYERPFSYIIYLTETSPAFLADADFEVHNGYKYYITQEKYEVFGEFSHEIIAYNPSLNLEGLVIIKE